MTPMWSAWVEGSPDWPKPLMPSTRSSPPPMKVVVIRSGWMRSRSTNPPGPIPPRPRWAARETITKGSNRHHEPFLCRFPVRFLVGRRSRDCLPAHPGGRASINHPPAHRLGELHVTGRVGRLRLGPDSVSYTHLRAHETRHDLVC